VKEVGRDATRAGLIWQVEKSRSKVHDVCEGCLLKKRADFSDEHATTHRLPRKQLII